MKTLNPPFPEKKQTKRKQIKENPMASNLLNTHEICLAFFNALFKVL